MASGNAHRRRFPELIDTLRKEWNHSLQIEQLIELNDRLNKLLSSIRKERNIMPPMMFCPKCKKRQRSAQPRVSIRATILSLKRFEITDEMTVKKLESEWKNFREKHNLDIFGKRKT